MRKLERKKWKTLGNYVENLNNKLWGGEEGEGMKLEAAKE